MLKFLLILILTVYIFVKVGGYLFRMFFIGASEAQRHATEGRRKAPNSNLNIDYTPKSGSQKKEKGYKGGEYVDYEEV